MLYSYYVQANQICHSHKCNCPFGANVLGRQEFKRQVALDSVLLQPHTFCSHSLFSPTSANHQSILYFYNLFFISKIFCEIIQYGTFGDWLLTYLFICLYECGLLAYFMSGTKVNITKNMTWFLLSSSLQSPKRNKNINKSLLYCLARIP